MKNNNELTVITAENNYQMIRILRLFEKIYPDMRWAGSNKLPTDKDAVAKLKGKKPSLIVDDDESLLQFSFKFQKDTITLSELEERAAELDMQELEKKPEIHITVKGRQTIAVYKQNGEEYARGIAKCAPEDDFDFFIGAALAIERAKAVKEENDAFISNFASFCQSVFKKIREVLYNIGTALVETYAPESETDQKGGKDEDE